jgi:thiol-disulfide isomerase/thioredoxin
MKKFCFLVFSIGVLTIFAPVLERRISTESAAFSVAAQTKTKTSTSTSPVDLPIVTQIDVAGLKTVLRRNPADKKPLLVNFWATYCEPCEEEFPELLQIDEEFRSRGLEFITISLDDLAEIKREVPKFLAQTKAKMPAYLLKTDDIEAAIAAVAPEWQGGMPFTILFDGNGKIAYSRQGMVKPPVLRAEIEKLIPALEKPVTSPSTVKVDAKALRELLKPQTDKPRPLLVNFWATWCPPCQKEFPELVKIDRDFRPQGLEFVLVSVDDATLIETDVPEFLAGMKATMPSYLLTENRNVVGKSIIANWKGGVPATVLYNSKGEIVYLKSGMVDARILRLKIESVLQSEKSK